MSADGVVESADDYKAAGNTAFKAGDFDEAIKQFTAAIELGKLLLPRLSMLARAARAAPLDGTRAHARCALISPRI